MNERHTEAVKESYIGLIEGDINDIWKDINILKGEKNASKWIKKFNKIAYDHTMSSRFALMRIFRDRFIDRENVDLAANPNAGFEYEFEKSDSTVTVKFDDISLEHAEKLKGNNTELKWYIELALEIAMKDVSEQEPPEDFKTAIDKAFNCSRRTSKLMTKSEAFYLGHVLHFTIDEMEWFLLRVCEADGIIRYNCSDDLIEAYGFLVDADLDRISRIKKVYDEKYAIKEKTSSEYQVGMTVMTRNSLRDQVEYWKVHDNDDVDDNFLTWLGERAQFLGRNSQTALCIFRNLVAYAYKITKGTEEEKPGIAMPLKGGDSELSEGLKKICSKRELRKETKSVLFTDDEVDPDKCKNVADQLYEENATNMFFALGSPERVYETPTVKGTGKVCVNNAVSVKEASSEDIFSSGKQKKQITIDRLTEILVDNIRVEKADMLYLIWVIFCACWHEGDTNVSEVYYRFFDFCDATDQCLRAAGLPELYPPHILEQTIFTSIVCAYKNDQIFDINDEDVTLDTPGMVYGEICNILKKNRSSKRIEDEFTEDEIAILKLNPYTYEVVPRGISYTSAFKQYFWLEYQKPGHKDPTKIFKDAGYNTDLLTKKRIDKFVKNIKMEVKSSLPFTNGIFEPDKEL